MEVKTDGGYASESTLQTLNGLMGTVTYDYIAQTQAATTDTWTFRSGGSGGTIVRVIVITYTDSGKETIANVERTT